MVISALAHVHLHLFHHVRGPAVDYVGTAVASFASWAGLPGPGEAVLIAASVFASKHKLDITPLIFWAWIGATGGGLAGWIVGLYGGRRLLTAPGPLHAARLRTTERGEELFRRVEVVAILLTPSWVAGIHRARPRAYVPTNTLSALAWAAGFGVGAYYAGPPVLDLVNDLGWITIAAVVALIVGAVGGELLRRRRRRTRAFTTEP